MKTFNKNVILVVTGGIAAYKSAELIRKFQDKGASVKVIMSASAKDFITPLTLSTLSGFPVYTSFIDPEDKGRMPHIDLARWADVILIAPATANSISKLATGSAEDLMTGLCLASAVPVVVAPAMNKHMWLNEATRENVETLRRRGICILGPIEGEQACGDVGFGNMMEPEDIVKGVRDLFKSQVLLGKTVLITAGPTREPIDPVRYLSNRSSGKMGYSLAEAARDAGARVIMVAGPTHLEDPLKVEVKKVQTAQEMYDVVMERVREADLFIGCAAVADYSLKEVFSEKIKKSSEELILQLRKNRDILTEVAGLKVKPICVGFAAETDNEDVYAVSKLERKGVDMIVLNSVKDGKGFESDYNELTVYGKSIRKELPFARKSVLARELVSVIATIYFKKDDRPDNSEFKCTSTESNPGGNDSGVFKCTYS